MTRRLLSRLMIALGVALVTGGTIGYLNPGGRTVLASETPATTPATTTSVTSTRPSTTTTVVPSSLAPPTTSAAPTPTTAAAPTTSPSTTPAAPAETVEEFVVRYAEAIDEGDVDFLFERLHPVVVAGFGPELCRNWVETEILQFSGYEMTEPARGPSDQPVALPSGSTTIEHAFSAPVRFAFQGQTFDAEAGFALVEAEMYWLGQCR